MSAGWRVVGVSVTGPGHVRDGVGNQDAFEHHRTPDGFVLAVAHGCRSALDAWLAVAAARDAARAVLAGPPAARPAWPGLARDYAAAVLGTVDPAATALLALVARPPRYLYLSTGDCFLVVEHRRGGAHLIAPPDGTTNPGHAGVIDDARITGVAAATGGLRDGMLGADRAADGSHRLLAPADFTGYLRAFATPGAGPADLRRRFESDAFAATSADDKTIVLAARP